MIQTIPGHTQSTAISVDGYVIHINAPVTLDTPKASELLRSIPSETWFATLEDIIEYGAPALTAVRTSATVQLLERQVSDLVDQLRQAMAENLGKTLQSDRELAKETLMKLLGEHSTTMTRLMSRYVDPNSKEGLPAVMAQQLDVVTKSAVRQVDALLQSGDDSALGKLTAKLTKQIEEVEQNICNQIAARNALMTRSAHKGRPFEEAITAELAELVRPYGGEVERVGDTLGLKRQKHGDHVITFRGPLTGGQTFRVAVEAKTAGAQSYSLAAVRSACQKARENRDSVACIFVGEGPEVLPDSRSFGPVGTSDYFVAWSPDGASDLLGITLYVVLATFARELGTGSGSEIDKAAMHKEIDCLKKMVEELSEIENSHSGAQKFLEKARVALSSMRGNIMAGLSRLDTLVVS